MDILRIEDREGLGPYASELLGPVYGPTGWSDAREAGADYAQHPLPMEENEPGFDLYWASFPGDDLPCFGFTGWPQMSEWFSNAELARLARRGAVLTLFDVPNRRVFVTPKQACFERRERYIVASNPLTDVLARRGQFGPRIRQGVLC